jgi:hypothetical protein
MDEIGMRGIKTGSLRTTDDWIAAIVALLLLIFQSTKD